MPPAGGRTARIHPLTRTARPVLADSSEASASSNARLPSSKPGVGGRETGAADCPFLAPIELNRFRRKNESAAIVRWRPKRGRRGPRMPSCPRAGSVVRRHQPYRQPCAGRFGVTAQGGNGRRHVTAFQPCNCGLSRAEPARKFLLRQPRLAFGREPAPRSARTPHRPARIPPGIQDPS